MRALLRKELRSLTPFLALVLFFAAVGYVFMFCSEFPDQHSLAKLLTDNEGDQVMMFVVAFALALGLLVRERDEGTLAFLDALPVTRAQIFASKFLLALGVLWLLPVLGFVLKVVVYAWSRTSLDTTFHWQILITGLLMDMASSFVFLCLGLALSFLRRFAFLVLGLLVCAYLLLLELRAPFVSLLNIFTLSDPVFRGQHWLLPTTKLATQLGLALLCLGLAFTAFVAMGDTSQRIAERVKRRTSAVVLAGFGTALAVLIWIGLFFYWGHRSLDDKPHGVQFASWHTSRASTARFQFLYPENRSRLVNQLLDRADAIEARVREFLAADPIAHIEADLTGSGPHTAGEAYWKKVQIDLLAAGSDIDSLAAVFAHELTHVYIDHQSEWRMAGEFNSTRFFHEGLASYVEHRLFRSTNSLASQRRVAAVVRARNEVKIEELWDGNALAARRDTDLVYPLGEVFVAALVARYGDAAPGRVVKAFARRGAPKDLTGFALWQDTLQACDYNLSDVSDTFFAELDRAVAEHRDFIDALPRLKGIVQRDGGQISVRAAFEGKAPGRVACRFRPRSDTPARLYEYAYSPEKGNLFRVDGLGYSERSFWYQLGWSVPGASQPIYESWTEVKQGR